MLLKNNPNLIIEEEVHELASILDAELKSYTKNAGWPDHIVKSLRVVADTNNNISYSFPEELSDEIDDLEYGAMGKMPSAAKRPFENRAGSIIANYIESKAFPRLFDALEVM